MRFAATLEHRPGNVIADRFGALCEAQHDGDPAEVDAARSRFCDVLRASPAGRLVLECAEELSDATDPASLERAHARFVGALQAAIDLTDAVHQGGPEGES